MGKKIIVLIAFAMCGCRNVELSVEDNSHRVSFTNTHAKEYNFVRHFSREAKVYFTIFDLATVKNIELNKIVREELGVNERDEIINLKIKGGDSFTDQVIPFGAAIVGTVIFPPLGFITYSMIGMRTYTIEGDIIRNKDSEGPTVISAPLAIDPATGLPLKKEEKKKIEFDPETGLPKK